jgi:ketosteroid isomerase-like protein
MSTEETRDLVRRYFEAGDRDELDAWDELCAENMTLFTGFTPPVEGLAALKGFSAGMHAAFSPFHLTILDLLAEGDRAAVRWATGGFNGAPFPTPAGEVPATNKEISMSGMSFMKVENGKIVEENTQADILGLLQQLGVVSLPGA